MSQNRVRFFSRVFDSITDPLAIYDRHYRINLVNQALVKLYELPARDVIGKHCYEVFHQRSVRMRKLPCPGSLSHGRNPPAGKDHYPAGRPATPFCHPLLSGAG